MKRYKKLKEGDPIEIIALDHTTEDGEGWTDKEAVMKSEPVTIRIRGFYIGEDKHTVKIAFGMGVGRKCYTTIFHIIKGTILKIKK